MYPKLFIYFVGLCTANQLVVADDERVNQLNALLKFPGWFALNNQEILDDGRRYDVSSLLAPSPNSHVVSPENIEKKLQQTHQLLSCSYARQLMKYDDCVKALGIWCKTAKSPSISLNCLNFVFLQIYRGNGMVLVMMSALAYFYQLSRRTIYKGPISSILNLRVRYLEKKPFIREDFIDANNAIIKTLVYAEYIYIDDVLSLVTSNLRDFFKANCWLHPSHLQNQPYMINSNLNSEIPNIDTSPIEAMKKIRNELQNITDKFTRVYYSNLGFKFDKTTGTTKIEL